MSIEEIVAQTSEAVGKLWIMNLIQWVCILYLMWKKK